MPIIVYVDMVADLFHVGHVEFLRRAKEHGDILKVGIHNDKTVESYKRQPIMNMKERISVVESCKYVDEVIPDAPLVVSRDYLESHNVDIVIHPTGLTEESKTMMYGQILDKLKVIDYTDGISTSSKLQSSS